MHAEPYEARSPRAATKDDRPLVRTGVPGIYRRGKNSYVVRFRDAQGKQRKRFARTLAEARALRSTLNADVVRGEFRELSRVTFAEYAPTWIATYAGRTTRGFRDETRREYRRALGVGDDGEVLSPPRGAVAHFGRMRLTEIEPRTVKGYVAALAAEGLAPSTIGGRLAPVRALLADAKEEGLIRSNPAAGIRIAGAAEARETASEERVKALTKDECRRLVANVVPGHRMLVKFLLATGLRISEAIALRWGDIDGGRVRVRRREYKGIDRPKSSYGRRDVPISKGLAQALWQARKEAGQRSAAFAADDAPVFANGNGRPLNYGNLYHRVMKPACVAAGVPWAAFHTLRHTCATMLFREGWNAKQVQMVLGHHSPEFTLKTYIHLLADDLPQEGLDVGFLAADESETSVEPEGAVAHA